MYRQKADTLAPVIVKPLTWVQGLLFPLTFVFSRAARLVASLIGGSGQDAGAATRDQLNAIVRMEENSGLPAVGESFTADGYRFTVTANGARSIETLVARPPSMTVGGCADRFSWPRSRHR